MLGRNARWAAPALAALGILLTGYFAWGGGGDDGEDGRRGRPRPQITYKGSSPYFKVDFDRYTGAVTCVWCHPQASAIWREKEGFHANAFDLLDEEARKDPQCVKCHVTAFNQDGAYPFEPEEKRTVRKLGFTWGGAPATNRFFEGVQCEACHGPNCGNRYSKERLHATCVKCHNEESPDFEGFDLEEALARIQHGSAGAVEKIDYDTYVGIEGCFLCHWPNYEAWNRSQDPHRRAFDVLGERDRSDPACLKCHTTGFNRDGRYPLEEGEASRRSGYTLGASPAANKPFEGVQCEACHGINCGTYTTTERIQRQCVLCHSGECTHDKGFDPKSALEKVRHRPPEGYAATGSPKVVIEWYDLSRGLEVARAHKMPLLVLFSNPPDG